MFLLSNESLAWTETVCFQSWRTENKLVVFTCASVSMYSVTSGRKLTISHRFICLGYGELNMMHFKNKFRTKFYISLAACNLRMVTLQISAQNTIQCIKINPSEFLMTGAVT